VLANPQRLSSDLCAFGGWEVSELSDDVHSLRPPSLRCIKLYFKGICPGPTS